MFLRLNDSTHWYGAGRVTMKVYVMKREPMISKIDDFVSFCCTSPGCLRAQV